MFSKRRAAAGHAAKTEGASHSPGRIRSRLVFWAILAVALLMLTTFVIFGALGGGMVKFTSSQARAATFSDLLS